MKENKLESEDEQVERIKFNLAAIMMSVHDPSRIQDICLEAATELAALAAERDQAIAHDRQPYPTVWAYEQACKRIKAVEAERDRAVEALREIYETTSDHRAANIARPLAASLQPKSE